MKANKGFTLLEVAVVLAIIAILAAILTPIVTSYIDQARVTRADNDVKKIAQAFNLFKRDTGVYPPYNNLADARANTNAVTCLASGPSITTTVNNSYTAYFANWNCGTGDSQIGSLQTYLNVTSGVASSILLGSEATGGNVGYRGPYLDGLNGTDPWGNPYVVNSGHLVNATNYVFAVSGGPDGVLNTGQTQPKTGGFTVGTGDVTALIR